MNLKRCTAVAVLALSGGWAAAQTASAPANGGAASPAKKELVQKVLQLQQPAVETMARALAERPAAALMQQAGAVLQQRVPAEKREAVAKEIQADLRKYAEEAAPLVRDRALKLAPTTIGPILDEKFTEDELRQVITALEMLQTPALRKFQQFGGEFEKALGEKLVAETRGSVEPKLQALEQSVGRRLGVSPAAGAASGAAGKAPTKKP